MRKLTLRAKWRIGVAVAVLAVLLLGYSLRDYWKAQARTYARALLEVRAQEYGARLEADEVEVIALDGQAADLAPASEKALGFKVHARATLRGPQAEAIVTLWRTLRRGPEFAARCHEPAYVLRFRRKGRLLFETSVCWLCHTYTLPLGAFGRAEGGFDADAEDAQALLKLLRAHVPLPVEAGP